MAFNRAVQVIALQLDFMEKRRCMRSRSYDWLGHIRVHQPNIFQHSAPGSLGLNHAHTFDSHVFLTTAVATLGSMHGFM